MLVDFRGLLTAAVLAVACVAPLHAQTAAETRVAEQARYWENRGRFDLAREAWQKLLQSDPQNPAALSGLGAMEARAGRPGVAQQYLDQLMQAHPDDPGVRELRAAIAQSAIDQQQLDRARQLAQNGEYDQSVQAYRQAFGDVAPDGRLALEYYQTLAGATNGWGEARSGLAELAKTYPNQPIYKLALAQHLTYREETRRQGISDLAQLVDNAVVAEQARSAWRQALIWLSPKAGDERYYRAYLNRFGQDAELSRRLASLNRPAEETEEDLVAQAYRNLNAGDLNLAYTEFQEVLRAEPNNPDALGGIGIILLRQEQFASAVDYLERARAADTKRGQRWSEALDSARFWTVVRQAESARAAGESERAIQLYERATADRPNELSVRSSLGDLYAEVGYLDRADAAFRAILSVQPNNVNALRGLIGVLTQQGRMREALALAERVPQEQRGELGNLATLKAQYLRDQASEASSAKNFAEAERLLKEALILDPQSPWVRLDLARLYQRQGRTREANTLIDGLLDSNPRMAEALYVKALLVSENQRWYEGLQLLEQVPLQSRTDYMNNLQRRLWVRYQSERAAVFARLGRPEQAAQILRQIEPLVGESPELLGALATALAEIGEEGEALRYMRMALSRQAVPDPGTRLQYASLLLKLRQDAEFEVQIEDLQNEPNLTPQQRQDLANLQVAHRLRQADMIREEGDLALAYEYLHPLLQVNPNDPRLLMALARLYSDAEEYDRTLEIYDRVLRIDPSSIDAYKGAIAASISLQQYDRAEAMLAQALEREPGNARLYALAGRLARIQGQDGRALEYFRQALALDAENNRGDLGGTDSWRHAPTLYLIDPERAQLGQRGGADLALDTRLKDDRALVDGDAALRVQKTGGLGATNSGFEAVAVGMPAQGRPGEPRDSPAGLSANRFDATLTPQTDTRSPETFRSYPIRPQAPYEGEVIYESTPYTLDESLTAPAPVAQPYGTAPVTSVPSPVRSGPTYQSVPAPPATQRPPVIYEYPAREPLRPAPALQTRQRPRLVATDPRDDILREISEIRAQRSAYGAGGLSLRTRDGQPGLDELTDLELPVEFSFAPAAGRVRLRAVPVFLDAGNLDGRELAFFGALPLVEGVVAGDRNDLRFSQDDAGVAVGLVYDVANLRLDAGSTPIGFREEDLQGGLRWAPRTGDLVWQLDLSRRSVSDSLLSYAGAFDPALGVNWGGVMRTGGRLDLAYDGGPNGLYTNAAYYVLEGNNVLDNTQFEIGAGFYSRAIDRDDMRVTWGINATSFFYEHNIRYFTFGHGGYFSPQFYLSLGVPVEWLGRQDRWSYRISGALGIQSFREDDAAYFPTSDALQSALVEFQQNEPTLPVESRYEGQSVTGLGFNLSGEMEYMLAPQVSIGATIGFDNARDYEQFNGMGFLRYWFRPQAQVPLPPSRIAPDWVGDPS